MLLLFSNISLHSRDIQDFKICKLAKWLCHTLTKFWSNMINKDISANLHQNCLILCSEDSTRGAPQYELDIFVTMAIYMVSDLSNIEDFPSHLGVLYWYVPIVPCLYDLASIENMLSRVQIANWLRLRHLYTWCNISLSIWCHQSCHLYIFLIFQT